MWVSTAQVILDHFDGSKVLVAMPDGSPELTAAIQHLNSREGLPKIASVRSWEDSFTSDCW